MRTFTKRAAITAGILFTAVLCMGIVYIDSTTAFWRVSGNFIQLVVSNSIIPISVHTNFPQGIGLGAAGDNPTRTLVVFGYSPRTNTTGNGTTAATSGSILVVGGTGGSTFDPTSASASAGGVLSFSGGAGGVAPLAKTNATGGAGAGATWAGGQGGAGSTVATNASTGGNGGAAIVTGGDGGSISGVAPTNGVGGNGGNATFSGGTGGTPTVGWARKGGNGGNATFAAAPGGTGVRTNGGNGGTVNLIGGTAGSASTGGDAGAAGPVNITAGDGAAGNAPGTNSNGGSVFIAGGSPGSGATPGVVAIGITAAGSVRGKTGIGILPGLESEPFSVRPNSLFLSNTVYTNLVQLVATNSTANTNIVIDYAQAYVDIYLTNNASFTNWVNMGTNRAGSVTIFITQPGTGTNTIVWPTLGAPSFGVKWFTNANAPMFTSFTGGVVYVLSDTWRDTNHHVSLTVW